MSDSFGSMLKRALTWPWNLLGLGAGVAFAVLSGKPDLFLPIVMAGELAYLGFLGTNARFQNVLKGKSLSETRAKSKTKSDPEGRLAELIAFLTPADAARFDNLRSRAGELTRLQKRMGTESQLPSGGPDFRTASLDKLLWLFLKLLHHKAGIERFLDSTSRDQLDQQLTETGEQIAGATAKGRSERLVKSLHDKENTIRERLANYDQAEDNREFLMAELDKTEQKITHIVEVAMTETDATSLRVRIDSLTSSIADSERAIKSLQIGDIFADDELSAPPLIDESGPPPIPLVRESETN